MASRGVIPGIVLLSALMALPAMADEQHRRGGAEQRGTRGGQQAQPAPQPRGGERAAPRSGEAPRSYDARRGTDAQRRNDVGRQNDAQRQYQAQRQGEAERRYDSERRYAPPRQPDRRDYDNRTRSYDRAVPYYNSRSYGYHGRIAPRIVRPAIVTVVPYRPYVYRPSWSIGVYYGSGNYYPYGYTPRGYYDPIPGRLYGGLRITGAPRDAQVFADGYYVGIVNDFDGIFQHLNLEAGPHHIEIDYPGGYEPVAFDVVVRPGETITYRADYAYNPY